MNQRFQRGGQNLPFRLVPTAVRTRANLRGLLALPVRSKPPLLAPLGGAQGRGSVLAVGCPSLIRGHRMLQIHTAWSFPPGVAWSQAH